MKITIFKDIKTTTDPKYITFAQAVERIKNSKHKALIEKIRTLQTKKERDELKKQLPSICFSGTFSKRSNDAIIQHSGLVCLDFDHLENPAQFREILSFDNYIHAAFISPSGDGVKAIVKIPANIETHAASCKALKQYFKNQKLDSFEDVARVCYESYDPDIRVNENSIVFTDLIHEVVTEIKIKEKQTDRNEIFEKLKVWIEKTESYHDGNKHKFLVKFAGALNRFGVSEYEASNLLQSEYQHRASYVNSKDFDKLVKRVYSRYSNQYNTSYFEVDGTAYERHTKGVVSNEFYSEYEPEPVKNANNLRDILESCLIDSSKFYEPPFQIYSIYDEFEMKKKRILTAGNISTIAGKQKSKKTFLQSMLVATIASQKQIFHNHLSERKADKYQVLLFDTEQSKYDVAMVLNRIERLAGMKLPNLGVFSLRGKSAKEIIGLIDYAVNEVFKNVCFIGIDQAGDLVKSMNSEEEAVEVVKFFEKLTMVYDIHVNFVIHQNKGDNLAQGWLGTQLLKKSEQVFGVTKDGSNYSISHVEPIASRAPEFEKFSFMVNSQGLPELLDSKTTNYIDI